MSNIRPVLCVLVAAVWSSAMAADRASCTQSKWPDTGNVAYVDSIGKNFLFRGALPLYSRNSGERMTFDYPGLVCAIHDAAAAARVKLPESFYLVDISLLQVTNICEGANGSEKDWLEIESDFFHRNPKLGQFVYWQTNGTTQAAYDVAEPKKPSDPGALAFAFRQYLAKNVPSWLPDPLPQRVDQLHQWLTGGIAGKPATVFYVHCYGGCDRTGETIASYHMAYKGATWPQADALNRKVCNGPIACNNFNAANWMCLYLFQTRGMASLACEAPGIVGHPQDPAATCTGPAYTRCPAPAAQ